MGQPGGSDHRRRPRASSLGVVAALAEDGSSAETVSWREILAPYARPRLGRSLLDVATSIVPYVAFSVPMYLVVDAAPFSRWR
jgi:omega-6 fatty acid desaturase (delta-12 desaturase)